MNLLKAMWTTLTCGGLILLGIVVPEEISWVFFIGAICIGGYHQTKEGLKDSFQNKRLNIELLMILSAIGACALGDFKEGAILIFIFSLAGSLEDMTLDRSNRDIRSLMEKQPQSATRINRDGTLEVIAVEDIQINDRIQVASGELVPVDGTIEQGQSDFEESSITGESVPVEKGVGDGVFGGTLNMSNPMRLVVDKNPDDMVLKRIVKMVEAAQSHQSKASSLIEKIEGKYALGVIIAVVVVILGEMYLLHKPFESAFYTGIVLLVVASPCALVASVTPATLAAISNGSRHGILVKGGAYFELLSEIKALAFDKTGTITEGKPKVVRMNLEKHHQFPLSILRVLEEQSTHPLAHAITDYLRQENETVNVSMIQEVKGYGIQGVYEGSVIKLGSEAYMHDIPVTILAQAQQDSSEGYSLVYISNDEVCIGYFAIADTVRDEAQELVAWLKQNHIEPVMITGDNEHAAKRIGKQLGIDTVIAKSLPDQKAHHIQELLTLYDTVGMIGDGINDAPALASASIGIAMSNGTDIAIETSDIVLTTPNLSNVAYAIKLSKRLKKISRQNIKFSLSVIVCLIILNFTRSLPLPLGVVFHEGSTILVIMNGLRMLRNIE